MLFYYDKYELYDLLGNPINKNISNKIYNLSPIFKLFSYKKIYDDEKDIIKCIIKNNTILQLLLLFNINRELYPSILIEQSILTSNIKKIKVEYKHDNHSEEYYYNINFINIVYILYNFLNSNTPIDNIPIDKLYKFLKKMEESGDKEYKNINNNIIDSNSKSAIFKLYSKLYNEQISKMSMKQYENKYYMKYIKYKNKYLNLCK